MKLSNTIIIAKKLNTEKLESGELIAKYDLSEIIKSYNEYLISLENIKVQIMNDEIYLIIECVDKKRSRANSKSNIRMLSGI